MIASYGRCARRVRSLFVSDLHLGCRHSQADAFSIFLADYQPDHLYLVGDFIDGWKLRRSFHWPDVYHRLLRQIISLARQGTHVYYAPGNHDAFLRHYLDDFGFVQVADQFVHLAPTGERFLVVHGDRFDWVETSAPWLSHLSTRVYDLLLYANRWGNLLRGKKHGRYGLCRLVKTRVKAMVRHFSQFEQLLADAAGQHGCRGVICGHIHQPKIAHLRGIVYCNTGDWVENCSGLVEHADGSMEIVYFDGGRGDRLEAGPAVRRDAPLVPLGAELVVCQADRAIA